MLDDSDLFTREACQALFQQIVGYTTGGGFTHVALTAITDGSAEWARNRVRVSGERQETTAVIWRAIRGAQGNFITTTRLDEAGLRRAVQVAEQTVLTSPESPENIPEPFGNDPTLSPTLWSEETANLGVSGCTALARQLVDPVEARSMVSTGGLHVLEKSNAVLNTDGLFRYYRSTEAQCSMTVRDMLGTASGWAGMNHYALEKMDPAALAARALDKAERSKNPVAVEPGRYTTILEPQAVADLMVPLMQAYSFEAAFMRTKAEQPAGPFGGPEPGTLKITQRVLDYRLIVRHDPMDADGGFIPFEPLSGDAYQSVNWVDQGILRQLDYTKSYAIKVLGLTRGLPRSESFRLEPTPGTPTPTVEEMIAKTERGVLVSRLPGVGMVDFGSMLCSGYTRDGIWLIEQGKVTKPIRNFRFTESPMFILNNLEDVGTPVRVFAADGVGGAMVARVAPPVRVRDFSFTSLAEAI